MPSDFQLYGKILERPALRFDFALPRAVYQTAYGGLGIFGPYDKNLFSGAAINCALLYHQPHGQAAQRLKESLINGIERFPGFSRMFRMNIANLDLIPVAVETPKGFDAAVTQVIKANYDLVFVIVTQSYGSNPVYASVKSRLLASGIPSQFVQASRFQSPNSQLQWVIANMALSSYAKVGGTPWVVSAPDRTEIVLGISRALDRNQKVIVGFTTVFKHNGDYILAYSKSPVTTWGEYEEGLEALVRDALEEYAKREQAPQTVVLHFHKRTGRKEVNAVTRAIDSVKPTVQYALLHLNSYSGYRLFDTSDMTHVPYAGLQVRMSSRQSLLLLDGRSQRASRPFIGTPTVLEITMDKSSTMSVDEFPRLVEQVYNFSSVNWRGFNARSIPVTINYSYLIAQLLGELESIETWNAIVTNGKLTDKAWFL